MTTLNHTSIRILIKLSEACTPSEIADELSITRGSVSHHLRRLVAAGLATMQYRTGVESSYVYYTVTSEGHSVIRRLVVVV